MRDLWEETWPGIHSQTRISRVTPGAPERMSVSGPSGRGEGERIPWRGVPASPLCQQERGAKVRLSLCSSRQGTRVKVHSEVPATV